jgi:cysteine desulfurase
VTIYLDYAATTPVDPRVAAAMAACLADPNSQANPASATHGAGLAASDRVEAARAEVAALIGAAPKEIIFTSGATEANNLALLGVAAAQRRANDARTRDSGGTAGHIISSRVEHKSVLDACEELGRQGWALTLLEPDAGGRVTPEALRTALRADTFLVSLMLANNEIGVLNDIAALAAMARAHGALVHTDASQAVGKLPVNVGTLGVDFLSLTAHKFYGPKGVGALYVREGARPRIGAVQFGGGHERGLRPGTLPTHQLVGLGAAASLAREQVAADGAHARDLASRLWRELESVPGVMLNGSGSPDAATRVPGLINVSFPGVEGESLVTSLSAIAVSTGSACSSATREPSYVLRSLGRSTELAQSSLRLSLGRFTTAADVDTAATSIREQVARLRTLAGESGPGTGMVAAHAVMDGPAGSLLARALNPIARRYFLAAPRPPQFPEGAAPPGLRRGRAGKQADGTRVDFELAIADGIVKSARFSVYGCPHTLAVAAWLCEGLEGSRVDSGIPGNPAEWAAKFEVPTEKLGRLLIVEDALRAALYG